MVPLHRSLRSGNQHKADIYDNGLVISLLSASAASYPKPYGMESRWWMVVSVLEGGVGSRSATNTPYPVARRIRTMNLLYARYEKNGCSGIRTFVSGYVYMQGDVRDIEITSCWPGLFSSDNLPALSSIRFVTTPCTRLGHSSVKNRPTDTNPCSQDQRCWRSSRPEGVKDHQWSP
jgi:hypothetical protein